MVPVVGVFRSRSDAEQCAQELGSAGIRRDRINMLTPDSKEEIAKVATVTGEQPGIVRGVGAVTGGAVGLALGGMVTTLLVPAIGPILAVGSLGGGLLGALAGGAIGSKGEDAVFEGLPESELFIYEDALRHGRTVVIAEAEDKEQKDVVRNIFHNCGAESIDRAREMWWLGLSEVERQSYEAGGGNFGEDERYYRAGFEAALSRAIRDKSYDEVAETLRGRTLNEHEQQAFRSGYERGRAYYEEIRKERE
jgi:hypothetical protein